MFAQVSHNVLIACRRTELIGYARWLKRRPSRTSAVSPGVAFSCRCANRRRLHPSPYASPRRPVGALLRLNPYTGSARLFAITLDFAHAALDAREGGSPRTLSWSITIRVCSSHGRKLFRHRCRSQNVRIRLLQICVLEYDANVGGDVKTSVNSVI